MPGSALPNHCPPGDAKRAAGRFFRLASKDSVLGQAPKPATWNLPIQNTAKPPDPNECDSYSHSVCSEIEPLRAVRKIANWARSKPICEFVIPDGCGLLLETPADYAGHHDWWPSPLDFVPDAVVTEA
jgi:hypothetical protein